MMSKKKKVLIDAFPLLMETTGIRTYTLELCKAINQIQDPNIKFLVSPKYQAIEKSAFFKGYLPIWKKFLWHLSYLLWKQLFLPILAIFYRVDALICPDFVVPAWKMNLLKIPVMHDAFFWQLPQNYSPHWRKYFIYLIAKGLRGKSHIVTTSCYSKTSIEQYLGENLKINVVYQSAPEPKLNGEKEYIDRMDLRSSKYILHVGYFDKRKNLPILLKAFKVFNEQNNFEYKLVLAGGRGVNKFMDDFEKIEQVADLLMLKDSLIMTGYLNEKSLISLYENAWVYVFPSLNEGFGIPVLEAMKYKIPVIVSDHGSLQEIGGNAVLVFDALDHLSLIDKLTFLKENPSEVSNLINKGTKRRKFFSQRRFLTEFVKLILKNS